MSGLGRREFVALLGGAAAGWPVVARAQQAPMPVIGSLHSGSEQGTERLMVAFRAGQSDQSFGER